MKGPLTTLMAVVFIGGGGLGAQGLDQALEGVTDGEAAFQYPIRDGVQVCEHGIRSNGRRRSGRVWRSERESCSSDRAEIVLQLRDGEVRELDLRPAGAGYAVANDLGSQSAEEAVSLLIGLARRSPLRRLAESALVPAVIARDVEIWPDLLDIARDRSLHREVREGAVFWIGQEVAEVRPQGVVDIVSTPDDEEVREAAVFALSQRAEPESISVLMELALTSVHAEVRRSAVFWLSQSGDTRVLDFFERLLEGG